MLDTYDCRMEIREQDALLIAALRSARDRAVQLSAAGRLGEVLRNAEGGAMRHVYLVKLLDAHPALGKVKGRRFMAGMGLDPFCRVGELTEPQRVAVLRECGEVR